MLRKLLVALVPVVSSFMYAVTVLAEETGVAATAAGESGLAKFGLSLGAGLGLGLAAAVGAFAQGRAVSSAMEGISRNPEAQAKMFLPLILGLVFIESLVIYMLVMAFFLQGKI